MSILNYSIGPNGQPVFPFKSPTPQDACQHVQLALPLHGTSSVKASQLSSTKKASVTIASEASLQGQCIYGVSDAGTHADQQNNTLDGSSKTICSISNLLKHDHQFEHREKRKISICGVEFQPFTPSFLHAFVQNDKLSTIEDVSKEADKKNSFRPSDVLLVSVSSAVKLDDKQIDLITRKMQRLTGFRKLRLENTIDPSLIAGFVISYCNDGSHVIDLSVKGQLATLAERLESSDQQKSANSLQNWSFP
ncbi:hypothetical protein Cni_G27199 [Canna indica]|uniref:ATP synthase delta chain n=1 Tax=Canna indica TaxID=4628 RepID=A0AAQ3QP27_9LILI|nr:hypothetical protein Cni_G27199 [Canna indica]